MLRAGLLITAIAVLFLGSCTSLLFQPRTNLFFTPEGAIEVPSKQDHGFIGTWIQSYERVGNSAQPLTIEIRRNKNIPDSYIVRWNSGDNSLDWHFTVDMTDDTGLAVIQIDSAPENADSGFFYASAMVVENELRIWTIDQEKLVARLKTDRVNSVIERRNWTTQIDADPDDLLGILRECFEEISKPSGSFRRVLPEI